MKFINEFKDYLTYSKSEKNGLVLLFIIMVVVIIIYAFIPKLIPDINHDISKYKDQISHYYSKEKEENDSTDHENRTQLFDFNPNKLSDEEWQKLGLSMKQIQVIKNYEKAGGKFYKKEDLKKIYSISNELYARLEPHILLPNEMHKKQIVKKEPEKTKHVEINTADSIELIKLPGIGPVFAGRIVKYRNLLGGFYSADQLLDVYGFDSSYYMKMNKFLTVNPNLIKKININKSSFKDILRHPYINYSITREIVNYRENNKIINSITELKEIELINDSVYNKIFHYFAVE